MKTDEMLIEMNAQLATLIERSAQECKRFDDLESKLGQHMEEHGKSDKQLMRYALGLACLLVANLLGLDVSAIAGILQ